jgi:Uma2 family endonuclease
MAVMTAVETGGRFTRADFEKLPEDAGDGVRYELLDGSIVMTPAPGLRHQRVVVRLLRLLQDAVVDGFEVLVSPLDVYLPTGDILEPDLVVITPEAEVDDKVQGAVPVLAVEVFSPSSRRRDVGDKLTAYRDAGVPSYWVVDPIDPRLRAWRLEDGEYVEVADIGGDQQWASEEPYAVTIRPADLCRA